MRERERERARARARNIQEGERVESMAEGISFFLEFEVDVS